MEQSLPAQSTVRGNISLVAKGGDRLRLRVQVLASPL